MVMLFVMTDLFDLLLIRKFFYKSVLMTVGGGEAARTNLGDVSTKNPFFSFTGPSMGGAKVLSMTNLANVSTKNPYFSFTGPSMVSTQVLSIGFIFRIGLAMVPRSQKYFSAISNSIIPSAGSSLVVPYGVFI